MSAMWARNRILTEIRDEIRLTRHEVELSREEIRLSRESRDREREFMRETTMRMERVFRELTKQVSEGRDEQRAQTQALRRAGRG